MHGATAEERDIFERALGRERSPHDVTAGEILGDLGRDLWRACFSRRRADDGAGPVTQRASGDLFDQAIQSAFARRPVPQPMRWPASDWEPRSRDALTRLLTVPTNAGYRASGHVAGVRARYEPTWLEHLWFRFCTPGPYVGLAVRGAWLTTDELWIDSGAGVWSAALRHVHATGHGLPLEARGELTRFTCLSLTARAGETYRVPRDCELADALRGHVPDYFT